MATGLIRQNKVLAKSESKSETNVCGICWENITNTTAPYTCSHKFCEKCINTWIATTKYPELSTCPMCRAVSNKSQEEFAIQRVRLDSNIDWFHQRANLLRSNYINLDRFMSSRRGHERLLQRYNYLYDQLITHFAQHTICNNLLIVLSIDEITLENITITYKIS